MPKVIKQPYYTMQRSLFFKKVWKEHKGSSGCVPINTKQTISYERLAPGEKPPPPKPAPTPEELRVLEQKAIRQKTIDELARKQQPVEPLQPKSEPEFADAEAHEKIPEFDLQDVPGAMDKLGWSVAAKLARKWFASPKHIYNDQLDSLQPLDDTTITLKWALKYGRVKQRLDELLSVEIYSKEAIENVKAKVLSKITKAFREKSGLNFETTQFLNDIRQFHIDWKFQAHGVSTFDGLDGRHMTDFTAAFGSCALYTAIGRVEVWGESYHRYDKTPYEYCVEPVARLTHVYVYIKDNYSFNDNIKSTKSQYLGHWNKKGMVLSHLRAASNFFKGMEMGNNGKIVEEMLTWDYLPNEIETGKPFYTRKGILRKLKEKDVYYPVYNKSFNEWREKHNRGGDFMIYSKPQLYKLKKPIAFKLETICRPARVI